MTEIDADFERYVDELSKKTTSRMDFITLYIMCGDDKIAFQEIRDMLGDQPTPRDWECEVVRRLLGSELFDSMSHQNVEGKGYYPKGFIVGFMISRIRQSYFGPGEIDDTESKIKMLLEETGHESFFIHASQSQTIGYLKGLQKGLAGYADENGGFKNLNSTTDIYLGLLLNADAFSSYESVRQIYDAYKNKTGPTIPHDFESFKKVCHRIGLRGTKYSSRVK